MAWGHIRDLPISSDEYDAIDAQIINDPPGLILHAASRWAGGMRIIDVWQSEQDYRRFEQEQIMPVMARLGRRPDPTGPPPATEFEIHNMRGPAA
jgi:hypothetical protein